MESFVGPLAGKTVLVTRPKEQSESLLLQIKKEGGNPLSFPVIAIKGKNLSLDEPLLQELSSFDWIIFTSKNGVEHFFRILNENGLTLNDLKFAAVGDKTAKVLSEHGAESMIVPDQYDASELVKMLKQKVRSGERILFPKGNLAPTFIKEQLKGLAEVEELVVYETVPEENVEWKLTEEADCIFFLSPSAVSFMTNACSYPHKSALYHIPAFCIGPTTQKAALEKGFQQVFMPGRYTAEDMVNRAISYFQGGK
jgi:uroporphyrinogen-III synthase